MSEFSGLAAFVQEYKSLVLAAIDPQPGDIVADLGCGLGFDVLRLAELWDRKGGQSVWTRA